MIELAVLDIAGTTVQEHQAVYTALEEAVVAGGAHPSKADIQRWMGAGKREAIAAMLKDELGVAPAPAAIDDAFAEFRRRLHIAYQQNPPEPLPGVTEAIGRLRSSGVKVALTTGFDREVTESLLKTIGWNDSLLDAVICVDDVARGRPAPYMIFRAMEAARVGNVGNVLTAGDTIRDLEAGTNAGAAMVVGVLTGGLDRATLSKGPHTHILTSVSEIPELLANS